MGTNLTAKDQNIAKLEWCIDELNWELDKAKGAIEEVYAMGFDE